VIHPRSSRARFSLSSLGVLASLLASNSVLAQTAADASSEAATPHVRKPRVPSDLARLVLDTGRTPVSAAEPGVVRLQIHGEYQLRYQGQSSLLLTPTATALSAHPGAVADSLGQNNFLSHWIRVTPRLQVGSKLEIVGQMDVVTGVVLGDTAHDTYADYTPRDDHDGFKNVQPRWLYLEYTSPIGLFRVGQQGAHWGMGIVANDGDHPNLFGDYRYGNIVDQVLFATKPLGIDSPWVVALGGGLVFKDDIALLSRGDHAWQGVLATFVESGMNRIGVYGVYRNQTRDRSAGDLLPYTDKIEAGVVDVAGNFAVPIPTPGAPAYLFGAGEIATIFGSTNALRTPEQTLAQQTINLRSYGGAVSAGFVIGAHDPKPRKRGAVAALESRPDLFGKLVTQIEFGYASGDADPLHGDGTEKRFVFNANHKVGLVLFDEVMRWQTSRTATAAQDPLLANASRPAPGIDLLPTNGGVAGAQYVYPTITYRPIANVDLKGGAVIAQTTADLVDPYRLVKDGAYVNYRGGSSARHDLGLELDAGGEVRFALDYDMTLQLGAQGGVLFPGGALADMTGERLKTPWLVVGRAGLQF
jgi:hypothetical protein